MSDFVGPSQSSRLAASARRLAPLAAAAMLSLAACGGGGGGAAPGPPAGTPSPIGTTPTPAPTAAPTAGPSSTPTPGTTAGPTTPRPSPTGSSVPPTPTPAPTPTITATPGPGTTVSVVPSALSFDAAGSGVPGQTVTAAQNGNVAGFVLSTSNCAGIATVSPASGSGPFTFSAVAAGTCSYIVTGTAGQSATVSITVTTTTIPQQ